jgi:glycosyltransferase involved in cell wall biosynthesis
MNVLFVLYESLESNSAVHVHHFANHLTTLGWDCVVTVPRGPLAVPGLEARYRTVRFRHGPSLRKAFANGKGPDVVHAWTPREIVRTFCQALATHHDFALIVHLEDNEECLLERMLGRPFAQLRGDEDAAVPQSLSHPTRYREFLAHAQGVTVIVEPLAEFVPEGVPRLVLPPGADQEVFHPREPDPAFAAWIGLQPGTAVLCYTGNVHPANAREVRSVYLAAAILSREGTPAVVLRTGKDSCRFLGEDDSWARPHAIELGYVDYTIMPKVLAMGDVLVQPGKADRFNTYRFPSKLPEYLAMGKPVILPQANVGLDLTHLRDALIYPVVDALQIVEGVRQVVGDERLRQALARGATEFVRTHLSWPRGAERLGRFYEEALPRRFGLPPMSLPVPRAERRAGESASVPANPGRVT